MSNNLTSNRYGPNRKFSHQGVFWIQFLHNQESFNLDEKSVMAKALLIMSLALKSLASLPVCLIDTFLMKLRVKAIDFFAEFNEKKIVF